MFFVENLNDLIDISLTAILINSAVLSFFFKQYFQLSKGIFDKDTVTYDMILDTVHNKNDMENIKNTSIFMDDNGIFPIYVLIAMIMFFVFVPFICNILPTNYILFKAVLLFAIVILIIRSLLKLSIKLFSDKVVLLYIPKYTYGNNPYRLNTDCNFRYKKVKFLDRNNSGEYRFFKICNNDLFSGDEVGDLCRCLVLGSSIQIILLISLISLIIIKNIY